MRRHAKGRPAVRRASGAGQRGFTIVEAPDVIEMTDKPGAAIRSKQKSSMIVGLKLQAAGHTNIDFVGTLPTQG